MTSTLRERPAVGPAGDTTLQHRPYPHYRIIVLDDDVNTFQHVVKCLVTFLPGLTRDQAWAMAQQVDGEGSAVVWTGPQRWSGQVPRSRLNSTTDNWVTMGSPWRPWSQSEIQDRDRPQQAGTSRPTMGPPHQHVSGA